MCLWYCHDPRKDYNITSPIRPSNNMQVIYIYAAGTSAAQSTARTSTSDLLSSESSSPLIC
jgi:hypothetical protein